MVTSGKGLACFNNFLRERLCVIGGQLPDCFGCCRIYELYRIFLHLGIRGMFLLVVTNNVVGRILLIFLFELRKWIHDLVMLNDIVSFCFLLQSGVLLIHSLVHVCLPNKITWRYTKDICLFHQEEIIRARSCRSFDSLEYLHLRFLWETKCPWTLFLQATFAWRQNPFRRLSVVLKEKDTNRPQVADGCVETTFIDGEYLAIFSELFTRAVTSDDGFTSFAVHGVWASLNNLRPKEMNKGKGVCIAFLYYNHFSIKQLGVVFF